MRTPRTGLKADRDRRITEEWRESVAKGYRRGESAIRERERREARTRANMPPGPDPNDPAVQPFIAPLAEASPPPESHKEG